MIPNAQKDLGGPPESRDEGAGADATSPRIELETGEFDELRALLLGKDFERLDALGARLDDPEQRAEEVSRVLPDAVARGAKRDDRLASALRPTVEEAVRVSVRRDAKVLVDALFPVMGPAIRRAVSAALGELVQSLNRTLEHSFSIQGLKWRLEAMRTGRSFAEIVMLHSLVYRVEQLFLIHGETGLLLQHVVAPTIDAPDAELVSAMLTAIQDFARDSFQVAQSDTLEAARVGELDIWVERGPYATVAAVIRGQAPPELRRTFADAVERIHELVGEPLANFDGDVAPFEAARPILESCLEAQFAREEEPRPSSTLLAVAVAAGLLLAVGLGYWLWQRSKWNGYLESLRSTPGIVVADAETGWLRWSVSGLRDPNARDPVELMRAAGIDPAKVDARWEPYLSLAPEMLAARARALLEPPSSVSLDVVGAALRATGEAPHPWIVEAKRATRLLPGVTHLDTTELVDVDRRDLTERVRRIGQIVIRFVTDTAQPIPEDEAAIDALAGEMRALLDIARTQGVKLRLTFVGHTDSSGSESRNAPLSEERAAFLRGALARRGVDVAPFAARGVATSAPVRPEATADDAAFNRSVTLDVTLED